MIHRIAASALALCITQAFCLAGFAAEDVPQLLNYQGKLTDSLGKPVDGSKEMTFKFYDDAVWGNLLGGFSETQQVVVTKGIFNVLIGSGTEGGVPVWVFENMSAYLSVKIEGQELSPRQRIASVAYAYHSAEADYASEARDAAFLNGVPGADIQAALADLQALKAMFWTLTIEPPQGNGSTNPFPGSYGQLVGQAVAITATAEPGWHFDHWEGSAVPDPPTVNPVTVTAGTAGQTKTLRAVFVESRLAPMCLVPAGTFTTSASFDVYLDAYYIDTYEVTNELYAMFLNDGGNDDHWRSDMSGLISRTGSTPSYTYHVVSGWEKTPVFCVNWFDATDFCAWRSATEGLLPGSYKLPTEAQWEKAAGWMPGRPVLWTYAFQSDTINCSKANYNTCVGLPTDVGQYGPSHYGCYDMSGNVFEWCYDWYGDYPSSTTNPTGPTTGTQRPVRGGSFSWEAPFCSVGMRLGNSPSVASIFLGFRTARTAQ